MLTDVVLTAEGWHGLCHRRGVQYETNMGSTCGRLIMISCSACGNSQKESNGIRYESGTFHDKNWSETIGTYSRRAAVPDEETALKIAQAIFDGMEKSKEAQKYVPQSVFYDNQDEIWIVSFWKNSNQIALGGDCSIALPKKTERCCGYGLENDCALRSLI